jgi:hypothetical protein
MVEKYGDTYNWVFLNRFRGTHPFPNVENSMGWVFYATEIGKEASCDSKDISDPTSIRTRTRIAYRQRHKLKVKGEKYMSVVSTRQNV